MESRMKGATLTSLALVVATLTLNLTAEAQQSPNARTGLMLGVHTVGAQGVTLAGEEFDQPYELDSGFGAGLTLGYAFNRTFSSFVSFDVAKQKTKADEHMEGSYGLGHLEFGVRANLPLGLSKTVPYVTGSMGRRALAAKATDYETGETSDVAFHGRMIGVGGGVEIFVSPTLSIDGGVQLSLGKFDHLTQDGEDYNLALNGTSNVRLRLGVTWHP